MFNICYKTFCSFLFRQLGLFVSLFKFRKSKILNNEDGMAVLETVPLLVVFMVLMTYAMGFWGAAHSGILSSIAARTYALETFRNRSSLIYLREDSNVDFYDVSKRSFRFHVIIDPSVGGSGRNFVATRQPVSFSDFQVNENNESVDHSAITDPAVAGVRDYVASRDEYKNLRRIWIQVGYGYCLDLECTEK